MTNRPFFAHFGSSRSIGAPGRASAKIAVVRKRPVGLERDASTWLGAQSLDRIAIDLADRAITSARLPRAAPGAACTATRGAPLEPVAAESWGPECAGARCAARRQGGRHRWPESASRRSLDHRRRRRWPRKAGPRLLDLLSATAPVAEDQGRAASAVEARATLRPRSRDDRRRCARRRARRLDDCGIGNARAADAKAGGDRISPLTLASPKLRRSAARSDSRGFPGSGPGCATDGPRSSGPHHLGERGLLQPGIAVVQAAPWPPRPRRRVAGHHHEAEANPAPRVAKSAEIDRAIGRVAARPVAAAFVTQIAVAIVLDDVAAVAARPGDDRLTAPSRRGMWPVGY